MTGVQTCALPIFASIALAGDRVFAAASSAAAQLHIVRFVDLATPVLERKYQLPLPYATATPGFASSIVYDDGLVYLGTEKWVGDEFSIIDIASSTAPVWESGLEMGSKVMDIYVADGMAHVATAGDRQLITVDVSDPSHPDIIDELVPTGWERQEGKVALRFEEEAIFGRTSGGFNIKSDHELFAGAASIDVPGGIYGIVADRFNIFAASRTAGKELIVFDRSLAATSTRPFGLPAMPQAMTCDGDRLYVLAAGAPIIYQITFR